MDDVTFETVAAGDAPVVRARIPAGGSLYADAGAMMAMSPNLVVESSLRGGVVGALSRARCLFTKCSPWLTECGPVAGDPARQPSVTALGSQSGRDNGGDGPATQGHFRPRSGGFLDLFSGLG